MSSKFNANMVKEKLNNLKKGYTGSGGGNNDNLWKPVNPTTVIRLLPYKYNLEYPFIELYFHYGLGGSMLSLKSVGKQDPISIFASKLYKSKDADEVSMAKKLFPKLRVYVPVIVRGEEDKGVRFWGFGKQMYEQILNIMADDDFGDITDPITGTDLTVKYSTPEEVGNDFGKTTISPKRSSSPLSTDAKLATSWLENQKDIFEIFKVPTVDELNAKLTEWLSTSSQSSHDEDVDVNPVDEKTEIKVGESLKDSSKDLDEFNKMFEQ